MDVHDAVPDGFEHPVCRPWLKPQLFLGAPQGWTMTMCFLFAIAFLQGFWPLIPLTVILQVVGIVVTRLDPRWMQKMIFSIKYQKYYKA